MVTNTRRNRPAYCVECPENSDHFILMDPSDPLWEKTPPRNPMETECRGCGPHHKVSITADWQLGYVSQDELDQGVAYSKPARHEAA